MNHPVTLQVLAHIHQTTLLKEAEANQLLQDVQPAPPWPTLVLWIALAAGALFLLMA